MQWFALKHFGKGMLLFSSWACDKTCILGESAVQNIGAEGWETHFNSLKVKYFLIKQRGKATCLLSPPNKINSKIVTWEDVFLEVLSVQYGNIVAWALAGKWHIGKGVVRGEGCWDGGLKPFLCAKGKIIAPGQQLWIMEQLMLSSHSPGPKGEDFSEVRKHIGGSRTKNTSPAGSEISEWILLQISCQNICHLCPGRWRKAFLSVLSPLGVWIYDTSCSTGREDESPPGMVQRLQQGSVSTSLDYTHRPKHWPIFCVLSVVCMQWGSGGNGEMMCLSLEMWDFKEVLWLVAECWHRASGCLWLRAGTVPCWLRSESRAEAFNLLCRQPEWVAVLEPLSSHQLSFLSVQCAGTWIAAWQPKFGLDLWNILGSCVSA